MIFFFAGFRLKLGASDLVYEYIWFPCQLDEDDDDDVRTTICTTFDFSFHIFLIQSLARS